VEIGFDTDIFDSEIYREDDTENSIARVLRLSDFVYVDSCSGYPAVFLLGIKSLFVSAPSPIDLLSDVTPSRCGITKVLPCN
jgi:hypothetical protein